MTEDARFEDARGGPLRLRALDADDLQVISSLCQDAIFPITEMAWDRKARRFGLLLNRLRREDRLVAQGTEVERVRTVLAIEDVTAVQTNGIDRTDHDTVLSVLAVTMEPGEDGTGRVLITLAGDGAVAVDVEALEVTLRDVTQPYRAPSGKIPAHDD
ncbi:hypothetical protein PARPLA_01625 [Rhodobacteraceae bacterium THAF1]|uniref:DUF2948 family protein n=1 Tax=Palleronia sp. THAF1 TaxID=2587842 RepID=UPI000F41376F|nr:DUF2948 family protein [Palleronia sp. THAF1]QFU07710.1 hypothetical protein FIU81_03370 [Palleronia sp. THAF1]VDC23166.1 hypothetical protein PARPLA_01625 [Rhodobacteraceae bacterium THAF1]